VLGIRGALSLVRPIIELLLSVSRELGTNGGITGVIKKNDRFEYLIEIEKEACST
jgi:hypothetical protein